MSVSAFSIVAGVGAITPFGAGADLLLTKVLGGSSAIRETAFSGSIWNVALVDGDVIDSSISDAYESRVAAFAVMAAAEALDKAAERTGLTLMDCEPDRVGVFVGTSAGIRTSWDSTSRAEPTPYVAAEGIDRMAGIGQIVSDAFAVTGPTLTVNTACSSGAMAIVTASIFLQSDQIDLAIVIGAEEFTENAAIGFEAMGAYATNPCSPFGRSDGLNLGEGAGAIVLTQPNRTIRDWEELPALIGYGIASDAHHATRPDPDGAGLCRALRSALEMAGITAEDLGYINLHGTGTALNDACEQAALTKLYKADVAGPAVSSTKGALGHMLGAAGTIEAIVSVGTLLGGSAPPTVGSSAAPRWAPRSNPLVWCSSQAVDAPYVASTNAAFGGHNTALVFGRASDARCSTSRLSRRVAVRSSAFTLPSAPKRPAAVRATQWRRMDRLTQLAACAADRALAECGELQIAPERWALLFATDRGPSAAHAELYAALQEGRKPNPALFPQLTFSYCPGSLTEIFGIRGPSVTFTSGRIGAVAAFAVASSLLDSGLCDGALVVAAETDDPFSSAAPKYVSGPRHQDVAAAIVVTRWEIADSKSLELADWTISRRGVLARWKGFADPSLADRLAAHHRPSAEIDVVRDGLPGRQGGRTECLQEDLGDLGAAGALVALKRLRKGGGMLYVGGDPSGFTAAYRVGSHPSDLDDRGRKSPVGPGQLPDAATD